MTSEESSRKIWKKDQNPVREKIASCDIGDMRPSKGLEGS